MSFCGKSLSTTNITMSSHRNKTKSLRRRTQSERSPHRYSTYELSQTRDSLCHCPCNVLQPEINYPTVPFTNDRVNNVCGHIDTCNCAPVVSMVPMTLHLSMKNEIDGDIYRLSVIKDKCKGDQIALFLNIPLVEQEGEEIKYIILSDIQHQVEINRDGRRRKVIFELKDLKLATEFTRKLAVLLNKLVKDQKITSFNLCSNPVKCQDAKGSFREMNRMDAPRPCTLNRMTGTGESVQSLAPDRPFNLMPLSYEQVQEISKELMAAISLGCTDKASQLAGRLAAEKIKIDIKVDEASVTKAVEPFSLKIRVEDRETSAAISLNVFQSDTVGELKMKLMVKYNFPIEVQRWIIGKKLPDDHETLYQHRIRGPGYTVYVYLLKAKSVNLTYADYEQHRSAIGGSFRHDENRTISSELPTGNYVAMENATHRSPRRQQSNQENAHIYVNNAAIGGAVGGALGGAVGGAVGGGAVGGVAPEAPVAVASKAPVGGAVGGAVGGVAPKVLVGPTISKPDDNVYVSMNPAPIEKKIINPEGWVCPACTYINVPTRPGCEICAQSRPDNYRVPEGYVPTPEEQDRILQEEALEQQIREGNEAERLQRFSEILLTDEIDLISNSEAFDCPICFERIAIGEGVVLRDCLHMFCRECLMGAAQHAEEAELKCPYQDETYTCESVMQEREIRALVNDQIFQQILQRSLTTAESQATNSYHCATTDCHGWCIYEDLVNFFMCPVCKKENCLTCKAIHEGQNCQQYQENLQLAAHNNKTIRQTKHYLDNMVDAGEAMHCPQCSIIIMKKDGCDWIKCSCCKTEICWVTKGRRWGPRGEGDISGGCRCNVNGQRCHTDCNNCH